MHELALTPSLLKKDSQKCPLPVIALARLAADLPAGSRIEVLADDPAARADIPAWCRLKGHTVSQTDVGEHTAYLVVVGQVPRKSTGGA